LIETIDKDWFEGWFDPTSMSKDEVIQADNVSEFVKIYASTHSRRNDIMKTIDYTMLGLMVFVYSAAYLYLIVHYIRSRRLLY